MPKICYVDKNFRQVRIDMIYQANFVIHKFRELGFDLTLRQLYYQLVKDNIIENKQSEYKRLGEIVSDARMAGLIDWDSIVDRTRNLKSTLTHVDAPHSVEDAADSHYLDLWENQKCYIECWIEKEALIGIIQPVCEELRIPFMACKGYASQSAMWRASQRIDQKAWIGKRPIVLHLGDHDPSGLNMTTDNDGRLRLMGGPAEVRRLALNMEQVETYKPPPNPAKESDSRYKKYQQKFGSRCWELDALEPATLADLIRKEVLSLRDEKQWQQDADKEVKERNQIREIYHRWLDVVKFLKRKKKKGK